MTVEAVVINCGGVVKSGVQRPGCPCEPAVITRV